MNALPALKPAPLFVSLYQQLCALPENQTGEIVNGQLHSQPRPSGRHGLAGGTLNIDIGGPFQFGRNGPGGWWIIPEPEVHFVRDTEVAVPDLAGWRRERMPQVPDGHRFKWCRTGSAKFSRPPRGGIRLAGRPGSAHAGSLRSTAKPLDADRHPARRRPSTRLTLRCGRILFG